MKFDYRTKGVCSRMIHLDVEDGVIRDISIEGGCSGNLQGICALAKGRPAAEVERMLRGIRCGSKPTSCPDQLACALAQMEKG